MQVLQPLIYPTFLRGKHVFRPGRSVSLRVRRAHSLCAGRSRLFVDIDLRVSSLGHHDVLDGSWETITDRRVLRLILRTLTAGVLANGVVRSGTRGLRKAGHSPAIATCSGRSRDKELESAGSCPSYVCRRSHL